MLHQNLNFIKHVWNIDLYIEKLFGKSLFAKYSMK